MDHLKQSQLQTFKQGCGSLPPSWLQLHLFLSALHTQFSYPRGASSFGDKRRHPSVSKVLFFQIAGQFQQAPAGDHYVKQSFLSRMRNAAKLLPQVTCACLLARSVEISSSG